jgi:hypothetical protein
MSYTKLREEQILAAEEEKAREENNKAEDKRRKKSKKHALSKFERDAKAKDLDQLLAQSAAFSSILTSKTKALGRVGTRLDGKAIGEHDLTMAKQPKCLVGGTMRDYQLEGLTWMYEICIQGMSGILADEMGLGRQLSAPESRLPGLTCTRQNCTNNIPDRTAPRARELSWATSDHRALEHPVELARRVPSMGPLHPGCHVSRDPTTAQRHLPNQNHAPSPRRETDRQVSRCLYELRDGPQGPRCSVED